MPIKLENVMVFSVDDGKSKNGYWCNVTVLDMDNRGKLELFLKDEKVGNRLRGLQGQKIKYMIIELIQNKFGTNLGKILEVS